MTYPDGEVVTNTYSPQMLLETVTGSSPYVTSTSYDSAGRLTGRALGNGLSQTYAYYPWNQQGGRLQTLSIAGLQNLNYQYDLVGNITRIENPIAAETQTYAYDALDRLTGWTLFTSAQTRSEIYGYDPQTGNLAWRNVEAVQPVYDPLMANLAAWWSMDESSGPRANRHGGAFLTPQGTVTAVAGQRGNSVRFSASTPGHLRQEDSPLNSGGDFNFTLAAQVYLENQTGTAIIVNKGSKMDMNQRDYTLSVSNGIITFGVGNGSSTASVSSSAAVTANAWHTVIAWHDAENDTLNLQIDNGTVFSAPYSGGASDTAFPLTVGAFADNTYVLNGRVDELALYKRLLTASERAWLHNSGQGRAYTDIPAPQLPPDVSLVYAYGDPAHAHAVTSVSNQSSVNSYQYDANGSQVTRDIANDGQYQLLYDAENRVVEVKKNGATIAQFTYDGDGKRVKSVEGGVTILFVGGHYEVKGSEITKYYFAGSTRIAMRKYTIPQSMTVEYFLTDHLGSTSITTDAAGAKTSEMRYNPWGEIRYAWTASLSTTPAYQLTRYTYTGQYSYLDDPTTAGVTEGFGLMFYNARWYDPALARFAQADSIIPLESQGVQAWDRYAGMNNNPVRYSDP
ncbi:MAG: hypothetical protein DDG60_09040, partial [Anaerolineae bacterium]